MHAATHTLKFIYGHKKRAGARGHSPGHWYHANGHNVMPQIPQGRRIYWTLPAEEPRLLPPARWWDLGGLTCCLAGCFPRPAWKDSIYKVKRGTSIYG